MNIVTRQIVWELVRVLLITTICLTLMMILAGLGQEAVKQGLGPGPLLRIIPFLVPSALVFAIPGALLFTACLTYGRMSADNEVLALKASGVSPDTVLWPGYILAFTLSLVMVWLNDVAYSWGQLGVQRVVVQSIEEIAYSTLQTNRSYTTRRFTISVKGVEGRELKRPTITFQPSRDMPAVMLVAESAELRFNGEDNTLSIFLTNGTIEAEGVATMEFSDTIERVVPLGDEQGGDELGSGASTIEMWQIPAALEQQGSKIAALERALALHAAYDLALGEFGQIAGVERSRQVEELRTAQQRMNRLATEPWRRWANGFSCLSFVLLGAPIALWRRSGDVATTIFLCFLPILMFYFLLLAYGLDRAKAGVAPPQIVWLGNVVFFTLGSWLTWQARRF